MYETTHSPPQAGTFRFLVFLILYTMRSERGFRANVLQASATVASGSESEQAGKDLQRQYDEYVAAVFPYVREERKKEDKKMRDVLEKMKGTAFKVARVQKQGFKK